MNDKHPEHHGLRDRVQSTLRSARHTVEELVNSVDADALYDRGDDIGDTKAPKVDIAQRWDERRFTAKLVNPANRRKLSVIMVGTGLAGASDSPYQRVVNGFSVWWVVLAYTVAMIAVAFHLRHGMWSALTTLGANTSALARRRLNGLAYAIAGIVTIGFLLPPFGILFGLVN